MSTKRKASRSSPTFALLRIELSGIDPRGS